LIPHATIEGGLVSLKIGGKIYPIRGIYLIFLLAVVLRFFGYQGLSGGDELGYLDPIRDLATGHYILTPGPYFNRWGLLLPESFLYYLFGPRFGALITYPFLLSLLHLYLTYRLGRETTGKESTGLLAALILATLPEHVDHSTSLLTDLPLGVFITLSFWLFFRANNPDQPRPPIYFFLSGFSWGLAYLCKETAVLVIPVYLVFLGWNFWKRSRRITPGLAWGLGCLVLPLAEGFYYYFVYDDPLLRYTGVELQHNLGLTLPYWTANPDLLWKRLFLDLFESLMTRFEDTVLLFPLAGAATAWVFFTRDRNFVRMAVWLWIYLLTLNFSSTSLTYYHPLFIHVRYFFPVFTPAAILCTGFLAALRRGFRDRIISPPVWKGAGTLLSVALLGALFRDVLFQFLFLALVMILFWTLHRLRRGQQGPRRLAWLPPAMLVVQSGMVIVVLLKPHPVRPFPRLDAQVLALIQKNGPFLLYSDPLSIKTFEFLDQYQHPERFVDYYPLSLDQLGPGYLWRQDHRLKLIAKHHVPPPPYILSPPPAWQPLFTKSDKKEQYILYWIPSSGRKNLPADDKARLP